MGVDVRIPAVYKTQEGILTVDKVSLKFVSNIQTGPKINVPSDTIIVQAKSDKRGPAIRITTGEIENTASQKNYIFTFNGDKCLEDREKLIKVLSEIIKKNKAGRISDQAGITKSQGLTEADIENRLYLLLQKKELSSLHSELVQSGLIPESEFWESKQYQLINREWLKTQKRASSPTLTHLNAKIKDEEDFKFRVTPEYIQAVLNLYPHVKIAYEDLVEKDEMSKEAFWNMYFEYIYRDKFSSSSQQQKKSIFDTYEDKYVSALESSEQTNADKSIDNAPLIYNLVALNNDYSQLFRDDEPKSGKSANKKLGILMKQLNKNSIRVMEGLRHNVYCKDTRKLYENSTVLPDLVKKPSTKYSRLDVSIDSYSTQWSNHEFYSEYEKLIKGSMIQSIYAPQDNEWSFPLHKLHIDSATMQSALGLECKRYKKSNTANIQNYTIPESASMTYLSIIELLRRFWSCAVSLSKNGGDSGSLYNSMKTVVNVLENKITSLESQLDIASDTDKTNMKSNIDPFLSVKCAVSHSLDYFRNLNM